MKITKYRVARLLLLAISGIASGRELLISAPVEHVDRAASRVTVLNHVFSTDSVLSVGETVNVFGVLSRDGEISDAVVQGVGTFGDPVFVKGVVTSVDPIAGKIDLSGINVDYTAALGDTSFSPPTIGETLAAAGNQAASLGSLVASSVGAAAYTAVGSASSRVAVFTGRRPAGITGTGAAGITGTGAAGITGTGAAGITGTGAAGITGTGAAGITGTGAAGITGTGAAGITGTGAAGITGTGAAGITGTGAAGITGTGTR